jgi:thymidine kinase
MVCHLIIGPMFSGKTSTLCKKFIISSLSKICIKYSKDDRYSADKVVSHDGRFQIDAVNTNLLLNVDVDKYKLIAIDEAHFFPDFVEFIELHKDKYIIASGLNGDRNQHPFDVISKAISKSMIIYQMADCKCGSKALFTVDKCYSDKTDVGGAERYEAVCDNCLHAL